MLQGDILWFVTTRLFCPSIRLNGIFLSFSPQVFFSFFFFSLKKKGSSEINYEEKKCLKMIGGRTLIEL